MKPSYESWEAAPLLDTMAEAPASRYTPLSSSFSSVGSYCTDLSTLPHASRQIERALKEGKLPEVVSGVQETVATLSQTPVSIAVTGDSGNGMSSFINALRVIGQEREDSAPTGVVRTTQARASYSSSHFPNVVLWDLPGMGATAQSVESYMQEMQFGQYDLFLIIASEQFSSNHVTLARGIQNMRKRFYVVWTKLDRDLSTSVLSEIRLLQNIQENIRENLQKEKVLEPPIFLVSNLDPTLHDFPKLRDRLHKDLATIRCHHPLETLSAICEKIIQDKVDSWKETIAKGGLQHMLGVRDEQDLGECLQAYRSLFGVDDESLQQAAQRTGTLVLAYKTNLKCQDLNALRQGDWRLKLLTCYIMNKFLALLGYLRCLCGRVLCGFTRMRQRRLLHLVAQDTKTIVQTILKDSIVPP